MARRTGRDIERTYGQYCPVATGLDVIGDRWVLLILRELSMGDRRFTDLRNELPGIAPTLLSDRLRALQGAGLVETVELPSPAARTVYRMTAAGRRVQPVLRAVAKFGAHFLEGDPSPRFDARRAAHALMIPWWRGPGDPLHIRLILDEDERGERGEGGTLESGTADVVVDERGPSVRPPDGVPDVTLRVARRALVDARRTETPVAARLTGTATAKKAFLTQFDLSLTNPLR